MKGTTVISASILALGSQAAAVEKRASDSTSIDLNSCSGTPQLYGQGILYGISGTNTPAQSYLEELEINYESAGGAQTDAQPAGYASSMSSYNSRFATVVNAWRRIRAVNGVMIVKLADLWGADETQSKTSFLYPGDDGDWTTWNAFCNQIISDLRANGMTTSYKLQLEIWNEPDINFGKRAQSQFNEAFVRATTIFRNAFPQGSNNFLPIVGPSCAGAPGNYGWWNSFLTYIKNNGGTSVQPDVWNWHMEGGGTNDPIPPAQYLSGKLGTVGLNAGMGFQNNEYSVRSQQVPSWQAWFKARYERLQFNGLRGNWASGAHLNDRLALLLLKNSDGSYSTTGDYQGWKYYAQMGNAPCTTTSGTLIDSYATAASNNATALIGSQGYNGTHNVVFNNMNAKFGSRSSVTATLIKIPYNNGGVVNSWVTQSTNNVAVSGNSVTVSFTPTNSQDGWAVRLT